MTKIKFPSTNGEFEESRTTFSFPFYFHCSSIMGASITNIVTEGEYQYNNDDCGWNRFIRIRQMMSINWLSNITMPAPARLP